VPANSPIQFMQFAIEKDEKERLLSPNKPHTLAQSFSQPLVPCTLFNAMIAPLTGFAIKGITWYQGEADAEEASLYARLFPRMITDWRHKWGQTVLPFLFVQLPGFETTSNCIPTKDAWAQLRDAQAQALRLPDTSMIVTIDQGEAHELHPKKKDVVAHRLALATLEKAYGGAHFAGPGFERVSQRNDKIFCQFGNSAGLHAKGSPQVKGFDICDNDRVYRPVAARIESGQVVLESKGRRTVAVRYAWANFPVGNLYNAQDLPAAPFCVDLLKK
jgi:sialate O-acetylesterase